MRRCLWKIAMAMENNGFFGRKKSRREWCLHNNKASAKKHEDARWEGTGARGPAKKSMRRIRDRKWGKRTDTNIGAGRGKKKKGKTVDLQFFGELLAKIRRSRIKHYKMFSGAARGSGAGRMLWWQTLERRDYLLYCGITAWNKHEESSLVEASLNPPL